MQDSPHPEDARSAWTRRTRACSQTPAAPYFDFRFRFFSAANGLSSVLGFGGAAEKLFGSGLCLPPPSLAEAVGRVGEVSIAPDFMERPIRLRSASTSLTRTE